MTLRSPDPPSPQRLEHLLAVLAHELRNPLAPMRLRLHLARAGRGGDPELVRSLDVIDRQVDYLQRLLDNLAAWAVPCAGSPAAVRTAVDLAETARAAQDAMLPLAMPRRIALRIDVGEGPHTVLGHADRLMQLHLNLLGNAFKFSDDGGAVTVRLRHRGGRELLQVSDNGVGIPCEQLRRIFDPFVKGGSSGGLGLGLAVVKDVATEHGGSVIASSAGLGRGAMFSVCLPSFARAPG